MNPSDWLNLSGLITNAISSRITQLSLDIARLENQKVYIADSQNHIYRFFSSLFHQRHEQTLHHKKIKLAAYNTLLAWFYNDFATCFNQILLPEYFDAREPLQELFKQLAQDCSGLALFIRPVDRFDLIQFKNSATALKSQLKRLHQTLNNVTTELPSRTLLSLRCLLSKYQKQLSVELMFIADYLDLTTEPPRYGFN